jgi:hypothetical protein
MYTINFISVNEVNSIRQAIWNSYYLASNTKTKNALTQLLDDLYSPVYVKKDKPEDPTDTKNNSNQIWPSLMLGLSVVLLLTTYIIVYCLID